MVLRCFGDSSVFDFSSRWEKSESAWVVGLVILTCSVGVCELQVEV